MEIVTNDDKQQQNVQNNHKEMQNGSKVPQPGAKQFHKTQTTVM